MEIETPDVTQTMEIETSEIMLNHDRTTSVEPSTEIKLLKKRDTYNSKKKQRLYYCPFCDRVANHKSNMRQHIRSHTDERPYKCSCCDKVYRKSSALNEHHRRVHVGEEKKSEVLKFKCEVCPKAFSAKGSLDRHLRSHFHEYVFKCNLCDKRFRHDSTFNRHIKTAHQSTDQMNTCGICNKSVKGCKSDLKKHIKAHLKENNNMHRLKKKSSNIQEEHKDTVTVKEERDADHDPQINKVECNVDTECTNNGKADTLRDSASKVAMKVTLKAVFYSRNGCKNVAATSSNVQDSEHARTSSEEDASVAYDSCDSNDFNSDTEDEAAIDIE